MKRIALIPARGGSKRLPRKNVIDFLGKPIIAYTIEAALKTSLFDRVLVSTEDDEIATAAKKYGATVDKRDPRLAADGSTVNEVCLDFLSKQGNRLDQLVVLYATAPMRNAEDIKAVVDLLSDDCHFALAVKECLLPVHQLLVWNDGNVKPLFPDQVDSRASQMGLICIDNGSTYAVHVPEFLEQKTFYGDSLKAHLMPSERSIDIDTPADLAQAIYHAKGVFA